MREASLVAVYMCCITDSLESLFLIVIFCNLKFCSESVVSDVVVLKKKLSLKNPVGKTDWKSGARQARL